MRLNFGFFNPLGLAGVTVLIEGHAYPGEPCPAPPTRPYTGADKKRTRLPDQQTIIWGTPSLLELTACGNEPLAWLKSGDGTATCTVPDLHVKSETFTYVEYLCFPTLPFRNYIVV
jgi:hypothetical protein